MLIGSGPRWTALAAMPGRGTGHVLDTLHPRGQSDEVYRRIADTIDHPEAIFAKAGYQQLWTADYTNVSSRVPKGLKTVPHEARVWEDWFRKHLTDGDKRLSTADLLRIKKTVAETIANDPACQFSPRGRIEEVARSVENARIAALKSLDVTDPSSALVQMTRLDAVTAFVRGQWNYNDFLPVNHMLDKIESGEHYHVTIYSNGHKAITRNPHDIKRYPTANEMLADDYRLNCARSDLLALYIVRQIEKSNPTGLKVGSVYIFTYHDDGTMGLHANIWGKISLPGGEFAHLYNDPTASSKGAMKHTPMAFLSSYLGPLDQASIERYINCHCIAVYPKEKYPHPVDYVNILNEKWPQFGLGNWDPTAFVNTDFISWSDEQPCKAAFEHWVMTHLQERSALDRAVDDAYSGKF